MGFWLAAGVSALIAGLGRALRALTLSGAVAAAAIGTVILWLTGWAGCAVLGTFFATSSAVGRASASVQPPEADAKGEQRDHWQVLANGGAATLGAFGELARPGLGLWLLTIGLAAAGADTWATAMGSLSRRAPRDILRGTIVRPGRSGGVTGLGITGGLMGAALVALAGAVVARRDPSRLFLVATAVGVAGMMLDSVLGAGPQGRFRCPRCGESTERRLHRCGTRTAWERGWRWLDNDGVNALCTAAATALGLLLWR